VEGLYPFSGKCTRNRENPPPLAGLLHQKLALDRRRGDLPTVLVKGEHYSETVSQGKIVPREVKAFAALD
jgi:hypothetical protein